jgi:hypothetical protein
MKHPTRHGWLIASLFTGLFIGGCSSTYYKVTDPQSGNAYYTQNIGRIGSGSVKVKDDRTGSTVTIQNSEIKQLGSDEYHARLAVQEAASMPVPTPVPAPAPTLAPVPSVAPETAPAPESTAIPAPATEPATTDTPSSTSGGMQ